MSRARRSETLLVEFVDGYAADWVFRVGDCFQMQLDIRLDKRIDKEANKLKEARLGRKLLDSEKIKRSVPTQGVPPAYSFDRGHIFHELKESDKGIRRSIVVLSSRPDPGALVETVEVGDDGEERTIVVEANSEVAASGFVDYEVLTYINGVLVTDEEGYAAKEQSSHTQSGFADLLRTGN